MARPEAAAVRQAWDCDCGGERRAPVRRAALSGLGASVARMRDGVVRMLGEPPTSCPWRAYGDPVVAQALVLRRHWANGAVDVDQQLAVVLEAMLAIDSAQNHVEALDMRAERERREAERRMAEASRKG